MERILDVAQFIFEEYKKQAGKAVDEMKLHKLLYFAQRENIAITGEPLFQETFQGWKYGPVSPAVRENFTKDGIYAKTNEIAAESAYILRNVILEYGALASWKLSEMSHKEISWKNSRKGMSEGAIGTEALKLEDIKKDAERVRPYDHIWDMYYDEFEDAEEIEV